MELVKNAAGVTNIKQHSTEDRITAYFLGEASEDDLSKKDKELMDRVLNIWTLLNNYRTPQQSVEIHLKKYQNTDGHISLRTAWNDYRRAMKLFGSVAESSEKARWILQYELAMKTFQLAATSRNITEMNRAIKNLTTINSNLKYDDATEIRPTTFILQVNFKGDSPVQINLDEYQKTSEKDINNLMSKLDESELTDVEILDVLEEDESSREKD